MDELKRLDKEVRDSLIRYVELNEKYNKMLPRVDETLPTWNFTLEKLYEVDALGKEVNKAREEWHEKTRKYLEYKQKNT